MVIRYGISSLVDCPHYELLPLHEMVFGRARLLLSCLLPGRKSLSIAHLQSVIDQAAAASRLSYDRSISTMRRTTRAV
jgi:hypothetical protein